VVTELLNRVPELRGNLKHDATTVALMCEPGTRRIRTRDTDFHRSLKSSRSTLSDNSFADAESQQLIASTCAVPTPSFTEMLYILPTVPSL